jgi:hypothetical protein
MLITFSLYKFGCINLHPLQNLFVLKDLLYFMKLTDKSLGLQGICKLKEFHSKTQVSMVIIMTIRLPYLIILMIWFLKTRYGVVIIHLCILHILICQTMSQLYNLPLQILNY